MRIIAVKSSHHYRAGFVHISSRVITCDGPGVTSQRIERLGHRRVRRPIWPLDSDVEYAPA
jgi:microcystin degradation protein MlrC